MDFKFSCTAELKNNTSPLKHSQETGKNKHFTSVVDDLRRSYQSCSIVDLYSSLNIDRVIMIRYFTPIVPDSSQLCHSSGTSPLLPLLLLMPSSAKVRKTY